MTERPYTEANPLRLLVSACLAGSPCGVDGTSYGDAVWIKRLLALPNVEPVPFCPEHAAFGTPRQTPDIHGGDGFAVLDGKARVLTETGEDWTDGMIVAAHTMLRLAVERQVELAILMDMSAACGSRVISDGSRLRPDRSYRKGPGVAAALLLRHGIRVVAQRDFRSLERLRAELDPTHAVDPTALDHHESEWYLGYFAGGAAGGRP